MSSFYLQFDRPSQPTRPSGRIALALFAIAVMLMGTLLLSGSLRNLERNRDMLRWPATPCSIIRSSVIDHPELERNYQWAVDYRYSYNGSEYRSADSSLQPVRSSDYATVERLQLLYPQGAPATCFVNPANPAQVVLRRNSPSEASRIAIAIFFLVLSALFFCSAIGPSLGVRPAILGRQSTRNVGPLIVLILLVFAVAGGLALSASLVRPLIKSHAALGQWKSVPCTIVSSRVSRHRGSKGSTTWGTDILYRYVIDGRELRSNRHDFFNYYGSLSQKSELVRLHTVGMHTICWVNPQDPTDAVLDPNSGFSPGATVIPLVVGAGFFWGVLGLMRRKAR